MKIVKGKIVLQELHFERLFSSLDLLGFDIDNFKAPELEQQVISLAGKNGHEDHGRVRVTVFRGEGGLYEKQNEAPDHIIETWSLERSVGEFNDNGLQVDIFRDARKAADHFSHIKSNNFLPYAMAAGWAKKNKLNDAILLNSFDRVADATIANVFIVTNGIIKTPALTEGCISGVMRKYIIRQCRSEGIPVEECEISVGDIQNASEVFLTNSLRGIRWVKQVGDAGYGFEVSRLLYDRFIQQLRFR